MKIPRVVAVFENTHATLKAEKILKEAGLDIRTAVKPSGVGPGCQLALTMPAVSTGLAAQILQGHRMRTPLFFISAPDGKWERAPEE